MSQRHAARLERGMWIAAATLIAISTFAFALEEKKERCPDCMSDWIWPLEGIGTGIECAHGPEFQKDAPEECKDITSPETQCKELNPDGKCECFKCYPEAGCLKKYELYHVGCNIEKAGDEAKECNLEKNGKTFWKRRESKTKPKVPDTPCDVKDSALKTIRFCGLRIAFITDGVPPVPGLVRYACISSNCEVDDSVLNPVVIQTTHEFPKCKN